jgi:hypothetical protein
MSLMTKKTTKANGVVLYHRKSFRIGMLLMACLMDDVVTCCLDCYTL